MVSFFVSISVEKIEYSGEDYSFWCSARCMFIYLTNSDCYLLQCKSDRKRCRDENADTLRKIHEHVCCIFVGKKENFVIAYFSSSFHDICTLLAVAVTLNAYIIPWKFIFGAFFLMHNVL